MAIRFCFCAVQASWMRMHLSLTGIHHHRMRSLTILMPWSPLKVADICDSPSAVGHGFVQLWYDGWMDLPRAKPS